MSILKFRFLVIGALLSLLEGCAFAPKNLSEFESMPIMAAKSKCKKHSVRVAFVSLYDDSYQPNFSDLTDKEITSASHNNFEPSEYAKILRDNIKNSEEFALFENEESYLVFDFGLRHIENNWGVTWITVLTLGVIPTYHSGKYQLTVKVFSKNGELLADLKSKELEFMRYAGLLALPFVDTKPGESDQNEVLKKFIYLTSNELLSKISEEAHLCSSRF